MENSFLINFKKSYILVPIAIIFGIILIYLNNKFSDEKTHKKGYVKISLLIAFISTFIVYIHNIDGVIEEEFMSGPTPF